MNVQRGDVVMVDWLFRNPGEITSRFCGAGCQPASAYLDRLAICHPKSNREVISPESLSDRTGSKRRPALVVQADAYNSVLDDTIMALITGSARRRLGAATQLEIDISTLDGAQSGLVINSVVQCENLVTVDRKFILRIRGRMSAAHMQKVSDCLKAALDVP